MNYQSARVFLSIVEHQSISAAAHALYLSQPAVSAYLSRLEDELGVQLFVRQRGVQKIALTQAGYQLISVAEEFLSTEKHLQEFKASFSQKVLRIGAAKSTHEYVVTPIAKKLQQKIPGVDLQMHTLPIGTGSTMYSPQPFDVAIRFCYWGYPEATSLFTCIPFFLDPSYILCPAETPLPDRTLSPEDLDPSFQIRQSVMNERYALWYQQHFPNSAVSRYPLVMDLMNLFTDFKDPRCWAFVPASIAEYLMSEHLGQLTFRRIVPAPPSRACYLAVSKTYIRSDIIDALLCCCREYLEEKLLLENQLPDSI